MLELSSLKVLFLAGTLGKGGAEQQLFYIARALKAAGADVRVLCLTRGEFWEERLRAAGVPVVWIGRGRSRLVRLLRVVREVRRWKPAILQSQHFFTNPYVVAAGRITRVAEVGAIRCDFLSEINGSCAALRRAALTRCRAVAVNSEAAMKSAIESGFPARRLFLLPNVVDTDRFDGGGCHASNGFEILGAGRLTEQKRFDRFLRVVAALRKSAGVSVHATIAGDGPLRALLERQAADAGLLPGGIRFTGASPDLREYYRQSDAFLLTSDFEGTPNVVLEAMACGLPVVSTRVGGVASIVSDGRNGCLADPHDEHRLEAHLRRLMSDAAARLAMGRKARSDVAANYSVDSLPKRLRHLYQAVLAS